MERRRAIMVDTTTGLPIDPNWQPTLSLDELPRANERMAFNSLHFAWQWVPMVVSLGGAAVLASN